MTDVLIINNGKHQGRSIKFPPDGILLIGRDPECHLRLASTDVSRKHCQIRLIDNGMTVQDLGSRNGTFIDGYLIAETAPLNSGSILRVGNMEFRVPGERPSSSEKAEFDDEIAEWLTEEGETDDPNLEYSTIIPGKTTNQTVEEPDPALNDYSRHPQAERAAQIIRHHWAQKSSS